MINNSVHKQFESWGTYTITSSAMLLEYSVIMTSSGIVNKSKNGSSVILFKWLINLYVHFYQISSLSPTVQGVQIKML